MGDKKPVSSGGQHAKKKLEMNGLADDANQKQTTAPPSGVTPTNNNSYNGGHGKVLEIGAAVAANQKRARAASSSSAVTPTNDTDNDPDWKFIDKATNIVFQFQENEDASSSLPYSLEVIWIHNDHEYLMANDASATGGGECSEKFVPLIEKAARKATKMTAFMVRYNNKLDRTWPYTKVSRVAEIVSRVKEGKDVTLESVDEDYFEYIVNLVPKSNTKKRKQGDDASFAGSVDFSHIDDAKKYYVLDYIGGDALDLM